jgi:hypothetical protein
MRMDIAAKVMADLKRENEANVEYNRLTSAVVVAAESVAVAHDPKFKCDPNGDLNRAGLLRIWMQKEALDELLIRVRALQEWRIEQRSQ